MTDYNVVHKDVEQKFAVELPDGEAFLRYAQRDQMLDFFYTFVPPAGRNHGVAEHVVLAGFRYAQANGFTVKPTCPYVGTFLRRHPEFQSLISASSSS